jgi:hypothetical protein
LKEVQQVQQMSTTHGVAAPYVALVGTKADLRSNQDNQAVLMDYNQAVMLSRLTQRHQVTVQSDSTMCLIGSDSSSKAARQALGLGVLRDGIHRNAISTS